MLWGEQASSSTDATSTVTTLGQMKGECCSFVFFFNILLEYLYCLNLRWWPGGLRSHLCGTPPSDSKRNVKEKVSWRSRTKLKALNLWKAYLLQLLLKDLLTQLKLVSICMKGFELSSVGHQLRPQLTDDTLTLQSQFVILYFCFFNLKTSENIILN